MPILNKVARTITRPLPRFLSPTAHAVVDYLTIASFFAMGFSFWGRSKRAALGAFICGGSDLALSLLTDYPGGIKKTISFPLHGELDLGLAATAALMPDLMGVKDWSEKAFFLLQGAGTTAVTNLTDFRERGRRKDKRTGRRPGRGFLKRVA